VAAALVQPLAAMWLETVEVGGARVSCQDKVCANDLTPGGLVPPD
jgi:hypothetical protein